MQQRPRMSVNTIIVNPNPWPEPRATPRLGGKVEREVGSLLNSCVSAYVLL
jgi:hypothetical protein